VTRLKLALPILPRKAGFTFHRAYAKLPHMSALEIQQMPRLEKLRLMEALWADLSRDEAACESPGWHAEALRETAERRARGEEQVLDWEQAKARLRQSKP
jgi:hypothetical protein